MAKKAKAKPKAEVKKEKVIKAKGKAKPKAEPKPSLVPVDGKAVDVLLAGLVETGWKEALAAEFEKDYFAEVARFVQQERSERTIHPPPDQVWSAFNETGFEKVRVVIIGQDPYHEPGQAHGMCFSVQPGITPPPSLKNIYKELATDIPGFQAPDHGFLLRWAQQGVLLLNATLTVREGHKEANSHAKCGWQRFTDEVIKALNERHEGLVFLLWGNFAQIKGKIVDSKRHKVINTGHPSPMSVKKWRGCKVFSKCNAELKKLGKPEIDWTLPMEVDAPPAQ